MFIKRLSQNKIFCEQNCELNRLLCSVYITMIMFVLTAHALLARSSFNQNDFTSTVSCLTVVTTSYGVPFYLCGFSLWTIHFFYFY